MSFLSPAEVQALADVTAESLAAVCGLKGDHWSDTSEDRRMAALKHQLLILRPTRALAGSVSESDVVLSKFSAKYLPSLVARYKTYTTPVNSAVAMINVVSHLPYFLRFQKTPECSDLVVLQATRIAIAENDPSDPDVLGGMCQFLSTLLILQGISTIPQDVKQKLVQKLDTWRHRYDGQWAAETSGCCCGFLSGNFAMTQVSRKVKDMCETVLNHCAAQGCDRRVGVAGPELKQCSRCKSVVYCGEPHQKQHWAQHKKLCFPPTF
ncbi:hypothetical protein PAXINDRAFT_165814 [Paxillus involutus ATCC 200175]|nr:hypothetical protein PAXINDRAFT_165814 [Paxillus involutus ATCC 200175]